MSHSPISPSSADMQPPLAPEVSPRLRPTGRFVGVFARPAAPRYVIVFAIALAVLGALAGKRLFDPSTDNHYAYMAGGWLDGRLALPGPPPHRNDWGRVVTVELSDGRTLHGLPCRTKACVELRRKRRIERLQPLGERTWVDVQAHEIVGRRDTWYVTFPPGPAFVMLPFVAIWGLEFWDVLFTLVIGAMIPVVLLRLLDDVRGTENGKGREHLWAAAAWTFASPACFVVTNGSVWLTAQALGCLALFSYVHAAWNLRQPLAAGSWLALAIACRPPAMAAAGLFAAWEWWRTGKNPSKALALVAPLAITAVAIAWLNWARFLDPFEFGHRYLDVRWQPRMQEHGLFSVEYLARNLHAMLFLLPRWDGERLRWSIHGMSLLLSTPWLMIIPFARRSFPQRMALWSCVVLAAIPSLLYQNTGQLQFSYRFALDWLPLALVAIVVGGGAGRRAFGPLVLIGAAIQCFGAYMYVRRKGQLFVDSLWPYGES